MVPPQHVRPQPELDEARDAAAAATAVSAVRSIRPQCVSVRNNQRLYRHHQLHRKRCWMTHDAHQQPSIVIENIDATDSFIYDPPFTDDRYPAAVAEVLQTHRMVVQDEYHYSDVEYDMYHYWDEAFWLVELGLAHRHVLEELITERATVTAATSQKPAILEAATVSQLDRDIEQHEKRAIGTMLRAISLYNQQMAAEQGEMKEQDDETLKTTTADEWMDENQRYSAILTRHSNYATACYSLAETLSISSSSTATSQSSSHPMTTLSARVYYQYAHDMYQKILSQYTLEADVDEATEMDTDSAKPSKAVTTTVLLDEATRRDMELSWAHTCLRLGVLQLSHHDDLPLNAYGASAGAPSSTGASPGNDGLDEIDEWNMNEYRMDPLVAQELQRRTEQAIAYFTNAANVFRKATTYSDSDSDFDATTTTTSSTSSNKHILYLATTLQNLGTALTTQGDLEAVIGHQEEAYKIYQSIIKPESKSNHDPSASTLDTVQAVSEVLMTLADTSLQLGRYQAAKVWYQKCMLWYERYSNFIDPRLDLLAGFNYDDDGSSANLLSEYELVLQDYQESLVDDASGDMDDKYNMYEMTGQAEYYGRDNAYEADLHMNIGSLYLTIGSTSGNAPGGDSDIQAASHLEQAIRLYELAGEALTESMGSTKYTYSIYHLRNGNYRLSEKLYAEALDIFHSVAKANGEDNSPFTMGGLQQQQQQQQQNLQLHHSLQSSQRKQNVVKLTQATDDADSVSSTTASRHPKETKPATIQAVTTTGQPGQQKSSTILVDVQQFLKQNDSIKEEL